MAPLVIEGLHLLSDMYIQISQQEAQGACNAHLVLTNPLGFVGFF